MSLNRLIFKKLNIPNDPMNIVRFGLIVCFVVLCGLTLFFIDYSDFPKNINLVDYVMLLIGVCQIFLIFFSMKNRKIKTMKN